MTETTCQKPIYTELRNGSIIMLRCNKCINCKTQNDATRKQKYAQKSKKNSKNN